MGGVLITLGFFLGLAGLVSLVKPLKFLRIRSRKAGALLLLFGFVLFLAGGAFLPPVEKEPAADLSGPEEDAAAYTAPGPGDEEKEDYKTEPVYNAEEERLSELSEGERVTEEQGAPPEEEKKAAASRAPPDAGLKVHFIDVGQGDAILIQAPKAAVLIDGGPRAAGRKVVEYLKQAGISSIDLVIATHPHEDHIGGLISVLKAFPVGEVIDPAVVHTTRTFEEYLTLIDEKDIKFTEGRAGMSRELGGAAVLEILHPVSPSSEHLNNASVVARLTFRETSFLFTGDAEKEADAEMLGRGAALKSTVLKVGHHGSRTSTTVKFLQAASPEVAVIMCGADNRYNHPHRETLKKLEAAGVQVCRTDLHGSIVVVTDGQSYDIEIR